MSDMTDTITPLEASNVLADLAARIRDEHTAVSIALKDSVRHGIAAGELLIEAKAKVAHGQWLPWLRDHCTMSERTAQLYMRLAKNRTAIEEQIRNGVADLSLNEAAAMLALSSDMRKLFDFMRQLERLSDPEEIIQLCLDSGVAQYAGTLDYESSYGVEQRREWDVFILFMVRHLRWPSDYADDHVGWLKRRGCKSPSEWMGEQGDKDRRKYGVSKGGWMPEPSDEAKQCWKDLLAQTAGLDRVATNKMIAEEDKALRAEIDAMPPVKRKRHGHVRRVA
jgi:Protein of unknown function (DUF3102)